MKPKRHDHNNKTWQRSLCRLAILMLISAAITVSAQTGTDSGPGLPAQTSLTIYDQAQLVVTNTATTSNGSAVLNYRLAEAPDGARIDGNGVITWTPSAAQVPSTNLFTTIVTDNGTPALSATNSFTVVVLHWPGVWQAGWLVP